MSATEIVALIVAAVSIAGWFTQSWLASRTALAERRLDGQIAYVERQIQELYGPLVVLLHEGNRAFADLLAQFDRGYVFPDKGAISDDELATWLYWSEHEFLPRNDAIRQLLKGNAHLIDATTYPTSYVAFLEHCISWAMHHQRWKDDGTRYSWHSAVEWPTQFADDVFDSFERLKSNHSALLGQRQSARSVPMISRPIAP